MGKKDLEEIRKYLGNSLFQDYMLIRNRISKDFNDYKDFQQLKNKSLNDIRNFILSFNSKSDLRKHYKQEGAIKLYDDSNWFVYKIVTYEASCLYGKGTKWCIASKKGTESKSGKTLFEEYLKESDGGLYIYIYKPSNRKYCVLQNKDGIDSIWNDKDNLLGVDRSNININLPSIKEVNLEDYTFLGLVYAIRKGNTLDVERHLMSGKFSAELLNKLDYPNSIITKGLGKRTLLMSATRTNVNIVRLLLQHGADPNIECEEMYTALIRAVRIRDNSDLPIIKELLEYGTDVNKVLCDGLTTLQLILYSNCAEKHKIEIIRLLLKYGANPNAVGTDGDIPIIIATKQNMLECVIFLVNHGANVNVVDGFGSPLAHAICTAVNKKMETFLRSHGARYLVRNFK